MNPRIADYLRRALIWAVFVSVLALIAGGFWARRSSAYPENIRHGYDSCSTCHVSPVGGGALTPYGRGATEAFLSSWSREGEGNPGYGTIPIPDWLEIGGDARGVAIAGQTRRYIPMQDDVEVAVKIPQLPGITVDASAGIYGPDHQVQYRRNYIKADLHKRLSIRAGRFMPAFGINLPDHTSVTRESMGLGEGDESYNAEVAWITPGGEAIGTFIYGGKATITADPNKGYDAPPTDMTGAALRNAVYIGSSTQVGLSYLGVSNFTDWRQAYGGFVQTGILTRAYALAEYDRKFESGKTSDLAMAKFGLELYQGLMATVQGDLENLTKEARLGLQWFPRPHWELVLEGRRSYQQIGSVDTGVLMLHHYL